MCLINKTVFIKLQKEKQTVEDERELKNDPNEN